MLITLYTMIASAISATLYRFGGASEADMMEEYPWAPKWFRKLPKKRDVGCGIVSGLLMWLVILPEVGGSSPWWIHLLAFGTLWGMLSTYWDWMYKNWDNFWMHGFMCGMSYMWFGIHNPSLWMWLGIRAVVMGVLMGLWCHVIFSDDFIEENGRGAVIPATLPILLFVLI